jgi:hypothetical protein
MIVYGSGNADRNRRTQGNLPFLLAGRWRHTGAVPLRQTPLETRVLNAVRE